MPNNKSPKISPNESTSFRNASTVRGGQGAEGGGVQVVVLGKKFAGGPKCVPGDRHETRLIQAQ